MDILSSITDYHQNCQECKCEVKVVISVSKRTGKWKLQLKISKNSNLQLKIDIFTIFSCSFHFPVYFPVTWITLAEMKLFPLRSKFLWPWETKAIDVHWRYYPYSNPWQLLLHLGSTKSKTMKEHLFHLPNEGL